MAYKFNPFTGKLDIAGGGGGAGTVTSITAGTGLTGGTITTSGTIAVNSSVVLKDANNNISANAFFNNLATITASGTQVVLTAASAPVSLVTGSGGQTIKLPDATTLTKGTIFSFNNNQSSGAISVNNNSNTLVVSIPSGGYVTVVLLDNTTAAGAWDRHDQSPSNVSWSTNTFDYPGSITSATWNGNTVAANRGGTGQSSPFVAGGIAYGASTSALGVTPIGTTGQVLTSAGAGTPTWTTPTTGTVTSVTGTSPIASSGGATPAISIADAAADGTTKGAAAFNASDFDATAGVVSIDYTNGQAASASTKGFLTSANWTTFNNKQATITTGAVDNAVLRADGTGGATLQNSDIVISDSATSPFNHVAINNAHVSQTNSSLALIPKGNGALVARNQGNNRGTAAVDLQASNSLNAASQVASGNFSFATSYGNTASNTCAHAMGAECTASGNTSFTLGYQCQATTASFVIAIGEVTTASGRAALSSGSYSVANRYAMQAHAAGLFSAQGDAQRARFVLRCKTTTNTGVEMALDGATTYLTIPSGKYLTGTINIAGIKSDGSATASYIRQFSIKNVAATTTLVGTVNTIGIDTASLTSISITANDASDYLSVQVTGILSETWRWVASVDVVEVAYGA